jgi:hypothetical protein
VTETAMTSDAEGRFDSAAAMSTALQRATGVASAPESAVAEATIPVAALRASRRAARPSPASDTEIAPRTAPGLTPSARVPRRRRGVKQALAAIVLVALLAGVALVVELAPAGNGSKTPPPPSSGHTTDTTVIPAPLQRAIDRLDATVSQ